MSTTQALYDAIDATWPAAAITSEGPWRIRDGWGGGQRVSAATASGAIKANDIPLAEAAMEVLGQNPLFMIRGGEDALDMMLADRGYRVKDPVTLYTAPLETLATEHPPRVTCFTIWEPLQIMLDIWDQGGIGPERIAIMHRAQRPKTGILGRLNDSPAATAFVACDGPLAMLHALEVLPHQRRQGMAVWMMRQAAFWALEQGARDLAVLVVDENAPANALYRGLGMVPMARYHYRVK